MTTSTTSTPAPIAVIGMACRFAGANNPEELWEVVRQGRDTTTETPLSRYDVESLYSPVSRAGTVSSRRAGYLDDIAGFDAAFFGYAPAEAKTLDPQHRLALMVAWEALEDAGIPAPDLAGSRTGVYFGVSYADYFDLLTRGGLKSVDVPALGNLRSLLPARLSFFLDLRGPSLCVDTACSSSLVALHLALQSLRAGECETAFVGGVNLKLVPDRDVLFSRARVLAPDGRCKFGDASADGAAFSEGAGVLVLKALDRALADGDRVRAVVLGSAVNNDGASSGSLLTPSVEAHAEMLRWAYENAGTKPSEVDFVEAHGTGTQMIDPVELAGLAQVLGPGREADRPCFVGSVKSNIGHAESAAGVAGIIKAVLCLEHREVVPSLHFSTPNPAVDWNSLPVEVPTAVHRLPDLDRPAIAGVSGQGISSVNAHVVLAEADPPPPRRSPEASRVHLLPISARAPEALRALALAFLDHLGPDGPGHHQELRDICFSAALRRTHHPHRLVVAGRDHAELAAELRSWLGGTASGTTSSMAPADCYLAGGDPGWADLVDRNARYVPLPRYPWQRHHHWLEPTEGDM
ncbi:beta-ketoacyl synthase N-terminal-like domain-containing protein [Lentzea sp. DG1S-22]|uniref:type I polyketide synthase n=1 Tax=Lentzea sp. DG1S-22 TaxID=3108822 RepID=UPI002E78981E|nr:beta-ketoacyl synthase N-terminal-like domain-containing protein [Lentzea sp. DG1S-22]WVH82421.1 beta-ketoacyl synthase N-terminal-like domain-containing protein [Lentzea sp. DG1S-22]